MENTFLVVEVWGLYAGYIGSQSSCGDRARARLGMRRMGEGGKMDWLYGWLLFRWDWPGGIVESDILYLRGGERRGVCLVRVGSPDVGGFGRWRRSISAPRQSGGNWGRFVTWMSFSRPGKRSEDGGWVWRAGHLSGRQRGSQSAPWGAWSCYSWMRRAAVIGGGAFAAYVPSVSPCF